MQRPHHPSKEEIITLAPMNRLGLADIVLINTLDQAELALQTLLTHDVLGYDTEYKPTLIKVEVSSGPHLVQFAT